MNPRNTTPGFSKRVKIRRNPFKRRNNRPVSLRRLRVSRLRSQGSARAQGRRHRRMPQGQGQLAGLVAFVRAVHDRRRVVALLARPVQRPAPFRGVVGLSRRGRESDGGPGIRGSHMNLGGPAAARAPDRLGAVFFSAPVPSGRASATALSIGAAPGSVRAIRSRCSCSKTRSRTPFPGQRFIRMWMARQLPNRLGSPRRSRPCPATCGMALSACGSGARTLPRRAGRRGAMRSRWASVSSIRKL